MTLQQSRKLRRNMTPAERRLWAVLRRKQLSGFYFRQQAAIGPFVADFFCPKARLVVEVDGGLHSEEDRMRRDHERTRWLGAHVSCFPCVESGRASVHR
jgi:very-short-patch-repair endonuclease